jgi:magnesium-transporting ATPase (P-type)
LTDTHLAADGQVNDAAALAQADLGMGIGALGGGTDAAVPMRAFTPKAASAIGTATTFETTSTVPLILTFRNAGTITVKATVTAPGTP